MRLFKTRYFARWSRKVNLTDKQLAKAVEEIEDGLIDANLGGNILKKRVAVPSKGKSGGFRTLLAFKGSDRSVFLYGFEKSDRSNISKRELEALKELAKIYIRMSDLEISIALKEGELTEVKYHG